EGPRRLLRGRNLPRRRPVPQIPQALHRRFRPRQPDRLPSQPVHRGADAGAGFQALRQDGEGTDRRRRAVGDRRRYRIQPPRRRAPAARQGRARSERLRLDLEIDVEPPWPAGEWEDLAARAADAAQTAAPELANPRLSASVLFTSDAEIHALNREW